MQVSIAPQGTSAAAAAAARPTTFPITASCPGRTAAGVPLPPKKTITCPFVVPLASAGPLLVFAVATAADGKRTVASNPQAVSFSRAPSIATGYCALISDTLVLSGRPGAQQPPPPRLVAGSKAPAEGKAPARKVCAPGSTGFKYTMQLAGFTSSQCGTYTVRGAGGGGHAHLADGCELHTTAL